MKTQTHRRALILVAILILLLLIFFLSAGCAVSITPAAATTTPSSTNPISPEPPTATHVPLEQSDLSPSPQLTVDETGVSPTIPATPSKVGVDQSQLQSVTPSSVPSEQESQVTDEWAVQLLPDVKPDDVAEDYDAENLGPVGTLPNIYLFRRPNYVQNETIPDPLAEDPRVVWLEQQVARQQQPRTTP